VNKREQWGSRTGFILAAAGSAVGLGNIWKFPYIAGENGGAAFLFIYLICIVAVGLPILSIEILLGRETQKNPVGAFKSIAGKSSIWKYAGALGVLASFTILSFYSVVGGWSLGYTIEAFKGTFINFTDLKISEAFFGESVSNVKWIIGYHTAFFLMVVGIILLGVKDGLERASKFLMPTLLLILIILAAQGLMLDGGNKGISFLFNPDWSVVDGETFLKALGHAFFTLSLGMGAMMTYGSYLSNKDDIVNATYIIVFLDTLIAILAGIAIFTVVFAAGGTPDKGPGLIFNVLTTSIASLPGAYFFGISFFLLLTIAAVTSAISILEVSVSYLFDELKFSRKKATAIMGTLVYLAAIPCALSFNLLSDTTISIQGKPFTFFDIADFLASNILLPLGGFFIAVFAGYVWGIDNVIKKLLKGNSPSVYFSNSILEASSMKSIFGFLVKFLSPVLIIFVLFYAVSEGLKTNPPKEEIPVEQEVPPVEEVVDV
tara:strand:+ start:107 stop:1573 length:1467 start_codon:yes stop_codon:yes gene_type:complete